MKCDHCSTPILAGDDREHAGRRLCEDCYMEALSPVKACDPWAVYSAQSMRSENAALTRIQQKILAVLKKSDGIVPEALAEKLGMTPDDLQREIATLRHMEKVRAAMQGERKVIRLW